MGWQPIETAVKDRSKRIVALCWDKERKKWVPVEAYWETGLVEPKWVFNSWGKLWQPTWWMPFPEPMLI